MSTDPVITLAAYKIVALFVGTAFAYMGYRLFSVGVFAKAGDLEASWGGRNLVLKRAAPGTFFALFGAIVVMTTILRKVSVSPGEVELLRVPLVDSGDVNPLAGEDDEASIAGGNLGAGGELSLDASSRQTTSGGGGGLVIHSCGDCLYFPPDVSFIVDPWCFH